MPSRLRVEVAERERAEDLLSLAGVAVELVEMPRSAPSRMNRPARFGRRPLAAGCPVKRTVSRTEKSHGNDSWIVDRPSESGDRGGL
jgi:hypothetical protein